MGAVYTPPLYSAAGESLDLEVRQGAAMGPFHQAVVLDDGIDTPFDLTGYTFRGSAVSYTDPSISVAFDFDTSRLDEGVYTFGLSDEKTAALSVGRDQWSSQSLHRYQIEMEDPTGKIIPLYYGELRVQPKLKPVL